MRSAVRVVTLSVWAVVGVFALAAPGSAAAPPSTPVVTLSPAPAGFEADSRQVVCALTGTHGAYTELPLRYTDTKYGLISGDSGSSFEFEGQVWWLFGNTGATEELDGSQNASTRWPRQRGDRPAGLDSDSIAAWPEGTKPPEPVAPYASTEPSPNEQCPELEFVTENAPVAGAYANPSVSPDPMFKKPHWLSLRMGELPEAGISEGDPAKMYVVFGTDNPANCMTLTNVHGPCAEPPTLPEPIPGDSSTASICGGTVTGSRTRSVMAVREGHQVHFKGLYDLSKPAQRYGPECPTSPEADAARFVNVQMADGNDGYVYI